MKKIFTSLQQKNIRNIRNHRAEKVINKDHMHILELGDVDVEVGVGIEGVTRSMKVSCIWERRSLQKVISCIRKGIHLLLGIFS